MRVKSGKEARQELINGINEVCDAAKSTMGGEGKIAILEQTMDLAPHPTKDGVTVVDSIYGKNSFEELGVKLIKNAAQKTVRDQGDGTTNTCVLAQKLVNLGADLANNSHIKLNNEIKTTVSLVEKELEKLKHPITYEFKKHVATVSANGDRELGELIADLYEELGENVAITVKEGVGTKTKVDKVTGHVLDRGFALPYFADKDKNTCTLDKNVNVLIIRGQLNNVQQIEKIINPVFSAGSSLLIVTDDIDDKPMETFVKAKQMSGIRVCVVISPDQGNGKKDDILKDLECATGAKALDLRSGDLSCVLGKVDEIVINERNTVFFKKESYPQVDERVAEIQALLEDADELDKHYLLNRIASLKAATAQITVGGASDLEIKEKKDRVDDAVRSVKSAITNGYVAGGGTALFYIAQKLDKKVKSEGGRIVLEAIKAPMLQILENANLEYDGKKLRYGFGYDVVKRKKVNLFKGGIVDSFGVILTALKNATTVATLVFSSNFLILREDVRTSI
jgi:chaperonin GroEL